MWRWFSALLLANASDLLFTYTAVERGIQEWNPVLRPVVLTPWPAVTKLVVLCLLGYGLSAHGATVTHHRPRVRVAARGHARLPAGRRISRPRVAQARWVAPSSSLNTIPSRITS